MNKTTINKVFRLFILSTLACIILSACNAKEDPEETYISPSSMAVTAFRLRADSKVAANLDSVFFSINLDKRVIFNADSLPKGTPVNKLVATISYPQTVSAATIIMTGNDGKSTEIDYKKNPTDTVDFTKNVVFRLTSDDGTYSIDYRLKVNVHQADPDSLMWAELANSPLPSRKPAPQAHKTVQHNSTTFSLIKESDGELTLSTSSDLFAASWNRQPLTLPFTPKVESFSATDDALYILDSAGDLYTSADGMTWTSTGVRWTTIIGAYGSNLLGLRSDNSGLLHTSYPAGNLPESSLEADFPVEGFSNFGTFGSKWSEKPTGILVGGQLASGAVSDATWGFDGNVWAKISENPLPKIKNATIVPYYVYRRTTSTWIYTEFNVWLLIGGELSDGKANRTVYLSYDSGVNWRIADTSLQLPNAFPSLCNADQIIIDSPKSADLNDSWKRTPIRRIQYNVDGSTVKWECPYIFIFGGYDQATRRLNPTVWRGALERLTFAPLI